MAAGSRVCCSRKPLPVLVHELANVMPIVLRIGPYRFGFFSRENLEPPHVHVYRERSMAKFWLEPLVELADNHGFAPHELNQLHRLVVEHSREAAGGLA